MILVFDHEPKHSDSFRQSPSTTIGVKVGAMAGAIASLVQFDETRISCSTGHRLRLIGCPTSFTPNNGQRPHEAYPAMVRYHTTPSGALRIRMRDEYG